MTISADYVPNIDLGNGTTAAFAVTFPFADPADIEVSLFDLNAGADVAPPPALGGAGPYDYTVTGTPEPGTGIYPNGTVHFVTAPPGNTKVVRARVTPEMQEVILIDNARFPAKAVEGALDNLELQIQEMDADLSRAILTPVSDGPVNMVLPPAQERADTVLTFDGNGNIENPGIATGPLEAALAAFLAGSTSPAPTLAGWARTLAAAQALYAAPVVLADGQPVIVDCRNNADDGYGGIFAYRAGDATTTFPQSGLGFVDAAGRRFFRLQAQTVSIDWFGADPASGAAANATAVNAALATGRDIYVPGRIYPIGATLTLATPYQALFGSGQSSELQFTLAAPGIAVAITGTGGEGRQRLRNLYLHGLANVTKLVSVAGRQVAIEGSRLANATAGGHGVYVESENIGANLFSFGFILDNSILSGSYTSGAYGVWLGNATQTAKITNTVMEHWGTHIKVIGSTDTLVIENNVLEHSVDVAVDLDNGPGNPFMGAIAIEKNHFEENQVCIHADGGEFHDLSIRKNFAYRNTATKLNSFFYLADVGASAASNDIFVEENYIEDFDVVFGLGGEYPSRLRGTHGNTVVNCTSYSSSTYADAAFNIRTLNAYYTRKLVSGAFLSENNGRLEAKNTIFEQPVAWEPHEFLEKITFFYVQSDATGPVVTVELRKLSSQLSIPTDTLVATVTAPSNGTYTLTVGNYADGASNYYLKAAYNNLGLSGFIYPFRCFFR